MISIFCYYLVEIGNVFGKFNKKRIRGMGKENNFELLLFVGYFLYMFLF